MIAKLIKGGVTTLNEKYYKANSPRSLNYDPTLTASEILSIDLTLSYGSSCLRPLPVGDFEFMSTEKLKAYDFHSIGADQVVGYIFEYDLILPIELPAKFKSFPLWPQKTKS